LREIEGCVLGRRNRNDKVCAVEDLVGKAFVLAAKENGNWRGRRETEQFAAGFARSDDVPLRGTATGGEARDAHHSVESLVDGITVPDAADDIRGVVRDPLDSPRVV